MIICLKASISCSHDAYCILLMLKAFLNLFVCFMLFYSGQKNGGQLISFPASATNKRLLVKYRFLSFCFPFLEARGFRGAKYLQVE